MLGSPQQTQPHQIVITQGTCKPIKGRELSVVQPLKNYKKSGIKYQQGRWNLLPFTINVHLQGGHEHICLNAQKLVAHGRGVTRRQKISRRHRTPKNFTKSPQAEKFHYNTAQHDGRLASWGRPSPTEDTCTQRIYYAKTGNLPHRKRQASSQQILQRFCQNLRRENTKPKQ